MTDDVLTSAVGLRYVKENFWTAGDVHPTNYPAHVHAKLAAAEETSFWFDHRNQVIGLMVSRFPPAGSIVDIGGGNGFVSRGFKQRGIPSILIEPDQVGASVAHGRGLPVICAEFSRDLFRDQSLSAIGLFDVTEHVSDDVAFLADCRAVLAPGGLIYLTVPALQSLWSSDDVFAKHCRRYDRKSLSELLQKAGFRPVALTYFFSLLVIPLYLMRTVPSRLGLRRVATADDAFAHHRKSLIGDSVRSLLSMEIIFLQAGRRLPIGTSLVAVARKA